MTQNLSQGRRFFPARSHCGAEIFREIAEFFDKRQIISAKEMLSFAIEKDSPDFLKNSEFLENLLIKIQ